MFLPQFSMEAIIERIFKFRQITKLDRMLLMKAMLAQDSFNDSEQSQINRVFEGLQSGLIQLID